MRKLRIALFVPLAYGWLRLNLALGRVEYVYNIGWGYNSTKPVRYGAAWQIQEHLKKLEGFEECPMCYWAARNWREDHGACDAVAWDRETYPEDYCCPGCGDPRTGGNLCSDCKAEDDEEALWNYSHPLFHGPSADQLHSATNALDRGESPSVTLFFSLDERDEDGGLVHVTHLSLFPGSDAWDYEGTNWCKNFKHPDGGQSPVRGRWNPTAKTGWMDFQIPDPPDSVEASTAGEACT